MPGVMCGRWGGQRSRMEEGGRGRMWVGVRGKLDGGEDRCEVEIRIDRKKKGNQRERERITRWEEEMKG